MGREPATVRYRSIDRNDKSRFSTVPRYRQNLKSSPSEIDHALTPGAATQLRDSVIAFLQAVNSHRHWYLAGARESPVAQ